MKYLRIKKWEQYQHYKQRDAPWLKLYRSLLVSPMWIESNDHQKALMTSLMLLAMTSGNRILYKPMYIQAVAHLEREPDLKWLMDMDFCEIFDEPSANVIVANNCDASKVAINVGTHIRVEERRGEEKRYISASSDAPLGRFEKWYSAYPCKKSKAKAILAFKKINPDDAMLQRMIDAIAEQQAERDAKHSSGAFVPSWPHASTWLNARRWEDEPDETSGPQIAYVNGKYRVNWDDNPISGPEDLRRLLGESEPEQSETAQ